MTAVTTLIQLAFCEETIFPATAFRADIAVFPAASKKILAARIFVAVLFLKFRITDDFSLAIAFYRLLRCFGFIIAHARCYKRDTSLAEGKR